jgi:hypothetical protein
MRWYSAATVAVVLALAQAAMAQNSFPDSGNVGIGTVNPRGALHILQPGTPPVGLPRLENGLLLGTEDANGPHWIQSYGGPLTLNALGNDVGIGRRSPTHLLDVGGATRFRVNGATNLLVHGSNRDDVYLDLTKGGSISEFDQAPSASARITLDGYTDPYLHRGEIVMLTKTVNDASLVERFRIADNGTVTIGSFGQVRVAGNGVRLLNARFAQLTSSRQGACLNELGGNEFSIAQCQSAAEYAPTTDAGEGTPEPGDLVSILPAMDNPAGDPHAPFMLARSSRACDPQLLGVISASGAGASGRRLGDDYLPLAVYGYFPVKVTMQNGPVRRGDPITSSDQPGYGMRSTAACRIVGYALQDADAPGVVQMLANLSDHPGSDAEALLRRVQALEARLAAIEQAAPTRQADIAGGEVPRRRPVPRHCAEATCQP